jgi:hypothetical protein
MWNGDDIKNNNNKNNIFMDLLDNLDHEKYFGKCRSVADFEKIEELGEGTYGRVCKYL